MTATDIQNGLLNVTIGVAMTHPAEFVVHAADANIMNPFWVCCQLCWTALETPQARTH
jgi:hypothetical protein